MHKKCNKFPIHINMWNKECMYLCFLPSPYSTAPIVYIIPPATNNTKPAVPNKFGNILNDALSVFNK